MEMEECISNGLVDESGVLVVALHGRMGGEAEESRKKKKTPTVTIRDQEFLTVTH